MQGMVENQLFQPPAKRGRKPLVDIAGVLTTAVENAGQWVSYELPMNKAKSLMRQLTKYEDIEVVSQRRKTSETEMKIVYVRAIEKPKMVNVHVWSNTGNTTTGNENVKITTSEEQLKLF